MTPVLQRGEFQQCLRQKLFHAQLLGLQAMCRLHQMLQDQFASLLEPAEATSTRHHLSRSAGVVWGRAALHCTWQPLRTVHSCSRLAGHQPVLETIGCLLDLKADWVTTHLLRQRSHHQYFVQKFPEATEVEAARSHTHCCLPSLSAKSCLHHSVGGVPVETIPGDKLVTMLRLGWLPVTVAVVAAAVAASVAGVGRRPGGCAGRHRYMAHAVR
mmetsp:Transcript_24959/g.45862  ORF Transcript_24959/g.45862 Transcript_24959/m.45862 type:complete len:214 (+) Transcript_24959:168-809(+)